MIERDNKCSIPNCYLLRTDKIKINGLYKIYVKNNDIYGAKLAGEIFDKESTDVFFYTYFSDGLLGDFIEWFIKRFYPGWINNKIKKRYELEEHYDTSEFDITTFLNKDKTNFVFNKCDIKKVIILMKREWFHPIYTNEGTIVIKTNEGKPMKFVVIGKQRMRDVARIFSDLGIAIEVKDKGIFYNKF